MRSLFAVLFVAVFLILNLPVMGILWIIGRFAPKKADLAEQNLVNWAFRVVLWISGVKLTVIGRENIPEDEAVLFVGNHRSIFDVVCTYPQVKGLTGYVAKTGVRKVPILGLVMKRMHCLFIQRDDLKQSLKIILAAIDTVKSGISIAIFPEGTRCKDPDPTAMGDFKEGSFKIATKGNVRIVPMAIAGTRDIFENHIPWIHGGRVTITYGEPIDPKMLEKDQQKLVGAYCKQIIQEMLIKSYEA